MANKGQASTEFLLLLAVAFLVLTAVFLISQSQLGGVSEWKEKNDAKNAVLDLSSAAKDVYTQGEGAKKKVYVELPSSYKPLDSSVSGNAIKINVRGSDYAAVEDFPVHGMLPGKSGGQWIWVISEGNQVRIGTAMMKLSKNSIFIIMNANTSWAESFNVENIWSSSYLVTPTITWNSPNVSLSVNPSGSFALNSSESRDVELSFTSTGQAVGYYSGEIKLTASDGSTQESVKVPITVEVVGTGTHEEGTTPPLTVTPQFWAESASAGDYRNKTFTICTNNQTSLTDVSFAPSVGSPGDWIGNTGPLGAIAPGNCLQKTLGMTVPNTTVNGTYEGTVELIGGGASGAEAMIYLHMTIEAEEGISTCLDNESGFCNCPVGADYWGIPVCDCIQATIYVMNGFIVGGVADGQPYNGTILSGSGGDIIAGTNGSDIIYSGTSGDRICGHEGDDIIYGGNGGDIINGGPGADTIYAEGSADRIYGGGGDDIIYAGQGDDDVDAGSGDDIIYGGAGKDLVYGGPGNDQVLGGDGDDTICGNSGNDDLSGDVGKDEIDGGTGIDHLDGGAQNDDCYRANTTVSCESIKSGIITNCGPS